MRAIGMTRTQHRDRALRAGGPSLLLGYTGLLSFGHGLFFSFAAYAATLSQLHCPRRWYGGPVRRDGTVLLGVVVGFFALRRGVYFSLLTLAFTALAFFVAFRWTEFTGGESESRCGPPDFRPDRLERPSRLLHPHGGVVSRRSGCCSGSCARHWQCARGDREQAACAVRGLPGPAYKLVAF
jgi:hypothetical protein